MSGLPSGADDEVRPWDRDRVWTRTSIGLQPRWWVALCLAPYLAVVAILAVTHAPTVAYALVTAVVCPALYAGIHRTKEMGPTWTCGRSHDSNSKT